MKHLIVVVGPTAIGKTAMSIRIAQWLSTVIISADSRQFFKQMNIGTAKPTEVELQEVPHYFIDSLDVWDDYNVYRFEKDVMLLLENELFLSYDKIVMTGGSGLYVSAVCEGIDMMPDIPGNIRQKWISAYEQNGLNYLQEILQKVDPEYYQKADIKNPKRIQRALEIFDVTGKPYSKFHTHKPRDRSFNIIKIGLNVEREMLYQRINQRMDQMIDQGLFEEAASLFEFRHLNALQTVGYQEIFGYLEGKYDKEEAMRLLKRNSRRYAKRQITWFKKDPDIAWFSPDEFSGIVEYIQKKGVEQL